MAVSAEDVSAHDLIWAIMLVSGTQAQVFLRRHGPIVCLLKPDSLTIGYREHNSMQPVHTLGYYSPESCASGREMLSWLTGGTDDPNVLWLGWRMADLPKMHQSEMESSWRLICGYAFIDKPPRLDPQKTYVFWTRTIRLAIGIYKDGSSTYMETLLPAF